MVWLPLIIKKVPDMVKQFNVTYGLPYVCVRLSSSIFVRTLLSVDHAQSDSSSCTLLFKNTIMFSA